MRPTIYQRAALREAELMAVVSRPAEVLSARFETARAPRAGYRPAHLHGIGEGCGRAAAALLSARPTAPPGWSRAATARRAYPRRRSARPRARRSRPTPSWPVIPRVDQPAAADPLRSSSRTGARGRRADPPPGIALGVLRTRSGGWSPSLPTIRTRLLKMCRPPEARRGLRRSRARGHLPALGEAAGMAGRRARLPHLEERARGGSSRLAAGFLSPRATTRCSWASRWRRRRLGSRRGRKTCRAADREFIDQSLQRESLERRQKETLRRRMLAGSDRAVPSWWARWPSSRSRNGARR